MTSGRSVCLPWSLELPALGDIDLTAALRQGYRAMFAVIGDHKIRHGLEFADELGVQKDVIVITAAGNDA